MEFEYDPMGNRIMKIIYPKSSPGVINTSEIEKMYYIRDAQSNVMATYSYEKQHVGGYYVVTIKDRTLYGSSRLGLEEVDMLLASEQPLPSLSLTTFRFIGDKSYELSNHLGNVLETVSDRKLAEYNTNTSIAYYKPNVLSYNDYFPFGMLMPGRQANAADYRYGFQGQEKDDELKGTGNSLNYKYRMHDPRVGRFFAVDPLTKKYPFYSSYAFSGNRVIDMVELEGKEPSHTPQKGECEDCPTITIGDGDVVSDVQKQTYMVVFNNVSPEDFNSFTSDFLHDPGTVTNNDWATYKLVDRDGSYGLSQNDHIDINIWGPDNGSVLVKQVRSSEKYAMTNFQTLKGHTDAGEIFFMMSYDEDKNQMSFTITNTTQTNVILSAEGGASYARYAQQSQWKEVMKNVSNIMKNKSATLKKATETIVEYDYDENSPNKMGEIESIKKNDVTKEINE